MEKMIRHRGLFIFFLLHSIFIEAQQHTQGMNDYDIVQQARSRASDCYGKTNPSPMDIAQGIRILDSALQLLDGIPVLELEYGNKYLKYRRHDVCLDLAEAYAIANRSDSAFYYLGQMFAIGTTSSLTSYLASDSALINIWHDPRFAAFLDKMTNQGNLWKGTAFKTPLQADLPLEEKVAGLSLLWSQAKYNFVYFDHLTIDWDQTYLTYLSKVKNTTSTIDYYKVLEQFYAQLKDGHSNVYPPDSLAGELYAHPPVRASLIEGRVFITEVYSDSLMDAGIVPGLEILQIDGQPVLSYAETYVAPYESSSTPQDLAVRKFTYALLCGPKEKPVVLVLKDKKGRIFTQTFPRSGYQGIKRPPSLDYQVIGDIGYLTLNGFEDQEMIKKYDSLFPEIAKTKGLIIDIRKNGGGSDDIGFHILCTLTDRPFKISMTKVRKYTSTPNEEMEWEAPTHEEVHPDGKKLYTHPVVLLIGPRTFSAGEDFAVDFDYMKRGQLIGQPTGGSTGQPILFDLPGGGTARLCAKRDTYPDGKEFVGIGIIPTMEIKPTVQDLFNGTDAVKNKAVELLSKRN